MRGPLVWVWTGEPGAADAAQIPDTAWLTDADWVSASGYVHVDANYVGLHENLLDLTHFSYLHEGTIGTPEWVDSPFEVKIQNEQVRIVRRLENSPPPNFHAVAMGLTHRQRVTRESDAWYVSPAMNVAYTSIEDLEASGEQRRLYRVNILHLMTRYRRRSSLSASRSSMLV